MQSVDMLILQQNAHCGFFCLFCFFAFVFVCFFVCFFNHAVSELDQSEYPAMLHSASSDSRVESKNQVGLSAFLFSAKNTQFQQPTLEFIKRTDKQVTSTKTNKITQSLGYPLGQQSDTTFTAIDSNFLGECTCHLDTVSTM